MMAKMPTTTRTMIFWVEGERERGRKGQREVGGGTERGGEEREGGTDRRDIRR